jgi:K+-sensing histidine kinase KdpD
MEEDVNRELRIPVGGGIAGQIFANQRPMMFDDLSRAEKYSPLFKSKQLKSLMGVPLKSAREMVGVIHVASTKERKFTQDEIELLEMIGHRIVIAIENARLYDQRKKDIALLTSEENVRKRFVSIIANDIRNPLLAAEMSAKLLLKQFEQPQIAQRLGARILGALKRSDQLIQDLLDINTVISKGPLVLERSNFDLNQLCKETIAKTALSEGDRFILEGNESIDGVWSRDHIARIIEVALDIGVRFGLAETPIILQVNSDENRVRIRVQFCGEVEKPQSLEHILHEENTRAQAERESRLSLEWTLVKSFSEAHGGSASIKSSKDAGTEIQVMLPRKAGS